MSKTLETLKIIEDNLIAIHSGIPHPQCPDLMRFVRGTYDIDLIENELKALEALKELKFFDVKCDKENGKYVYCIVWNCVEICRISEKQYKVLEGML